MKTEIKRLFLIVIIGFYIAIAMPSVATEVKPSYLYNLSNFTGTIPYDWARVFADKEKNEIYVLYGNSIKVFNESGMEIFSFGEDIDLGHITDLAIDKNGNILLLSYKESGPLITCCNFRGEPIGKIEIKNLPPEFSKFSPNRIVYREGNLYLSSQAGMKIIITDSDGNFKDGYDIVSILGFEEKDRGNTQMDGFSVDREGNMLFTIPVLFHAYRLSTDRKIDSFGKPGSSPGKFGVVAGIAEDSRGNYLVVDILKSVVMVFDRDFNFISEFGYRGLNPGNLVAPNDLAIDSKDRVYVTQSRKKGVSVFSLTYN